MKQNRFNHFCGNFLALTTLGIVANRAHHMRKKYGEPKEKMFLSDLQYLGSYMIDRYVFSNEKLIEWVDTRLHFTEI